MGLTGIATSVRGTWVYQQAATPRIVLLPLVLAKCAPRAPHRRTHDLSTCFFSTVAYSTKVASVSALGASALLSVGAGDNRGVFSMCDYSLHSIKSRPAKVGDKLTTRNFNTGTRGFAASEDASV